MSDYDPSRLNPQALTARLRLEQTIVGNSRIQVNSGSLQLGEMRSSVFDTVDGVIFIDSASTIHVDVLRNAARKIESGRYLSGFIKVTDEGVVEWVTSGAMSSFPPDDLPVPFSQVQDKIRGTGVRVVT